MAAPNIVNITSVYGRSTGLLLTTSNQDVLLNAASSNKVLKINSIFATNITADNSNALLTAAFYDSSITTTLEFSNLTVIPPFTTLVVVDKDSSFYLEEGDKIIAKADKANGIKFIISYEEVA